MTCVFCRIARGEAPARMVWEDDRFLAFLDARPIAPGHLLLIPREHVDYLFDLEEDLYAPLFARVKNLAGPLRQAMRCDRIGVAIEGYGVAHAHIHLVPINGRLELDPNRHALLAETELDEIAERIRAAFREVS